MVYNSQKLYSQLLRKRSLCDLQLLFQKSAEYPEIATAIGAEIDRRMAACSSREETYPRATAGHLTEAKTDLNLAAR